MKTSQSLGEKIVRGGIIAILLTLVGSVSAYLIRVLYSRILSIEDYGLFFAVFGFFNILSTYTELGFGGAITYFVPKHLKAKKYWALWNTFIYGQIIQVGTAILLSAILISITPILATKYFKVAGSESLVYIFCVFLILASLLNSLNQIFTGLQKVKYYSSINAFKTFLILLFSLIFLLFGFKTISIFGISWVLGYLFTSVSYLYLLWKNHPHLTSNTLFWHKETFRSMYKYALPVFASTIIFSLMISSDLFFLTLFRGIKEVGIYNVIIPLASIPLMLLTPLNNIFFPLVSHLHEGEKEKLSYLVSKIYEIIPFIGVYFALFIIIFPSNIIGLIFGEKWLGKAELSLTLLSLGYIVNLLTNILDTVILGIGKSKERLKIYLIVAVMAFSLHFILIKQLGVLGAVIANSLSYLALTLIFTNLIRTRVKFKIPYGLYLKILSVSILLYLFVKSTGFSPKSIIELIISGAIYSLIFILFGYLIKIYDKRLLLTILPVRKNIIS